MLSVLAAAITASTVITNADGTFTVFSQAPSVRSEPPSQTVMVTNRFVLRDGTITNIAHAMYYRTYSKEEYAERVRQLEALREIVMRRMKEGAPPPVPQKTDPQRDRKQKGHHPHAPNPKDL